ncbi:DNA cytosine methyltransferase [Leucobacter sp. VD1]|uniref:DNA cytosine methyltransferase n=1 Tax=Leucobacter sp. VD1 TaxID=3080381 RepID=UPI0030159D44
MSAPITAVDHFAGLGWGVACERLGIREYGVEIAPSAIRMRSANGMRTIYRDVWTGLFGSEMVPEHDLYIASPPCQTFSMAGKGEGRKALDDVLSLIDRHAYSSGWMLEHSTLNLDPRTALVLTPLAHIWQHRPRLIALEQVPEVLPVWHAYATVLRSIGYSVWAGILRAEQYGVPQTRKRAILMARLDGKVEPPTPTHSRFYETNRARLDPGVEKWVSMAQALGWGMTQRPYPTIASARSTGGPDKEKVGGSGARKKIYDELEAGRWLGPGGVDPRYPATSVTTKHIIGSRGHHGKGEYLKAPVPSDEVREAFKVMGSGMVERHGERPARSQDEPAFTIRANAGGAEPGGFRIREIGEGADPRGVRISLLEAAALQSFPPDTVWKGTQTQRFTVVGNAVPPLLAEAILAALIAPPAERDAWDLAFAEVYG